MAKHRRGPKPQVGFLRILAAELGDVIRLVIGRMVLWLILPAAEEKWGRDAATYHLADGPLLHFPRDPLIFPTCRDDL